MSAHHPEISRQNLGDAPGIKGIRWNMDWITRPLFGIALAVVAIWVLFHDPVYFAGLVALIGIPAAFEWHRMVSGGKPHRLTAAVTAITLALCVLALALGMSVLVSFGLIALGVAACAVLALQRGDDPLWQGLGVIYLAIPSLALVALRTLSAHGALVIVGLFIIVWATDTGALICGNLIGGPRLAPALSPGKTWAGTIGGSIIAALAFAAFIALLDGAPGLAFAVGFGFSFAAHGGDLFESFVKRRFGLKNSGAIIPGHGGVLDRMDSTLGAATLMALLVFTIHFNPLIGVHS